MNRFGFTDRQMDLIKNAIDRFEEIDCAVIFGSRAMGNFKKGSDVDIAIKGARINGNTASALSTLLNEELPLPFFFDIVHYNTLDNTALTEHIDQQGAAI